MRANSDVVAHMNAELAALRQERDVLQASVQALRNPDNSARRKQARTLAAPSPSLQVPKTVHPGWNL